VNRTRQTFETVERSEPLDAAFGRWSQEPDKTLVVTDHGRLVGLVSLDHIHNLLRLQRPIAGCQAHVTRAKPATALRTGTHR
jgi:hypothetical protein